jgi:hypothetical protein
MIIADCFMDTDTLFTTIFALGWEKAAIVESLGEIGIRLRFTDTNIRLAIGAENTFTLTDPLYRLEWPANRPD